MAREYLRITPEVTWGTFASGGTHTVLDLDQSNAFTMRKAPSRWSIRSAGSYNRRRLTGSSKTAIGGNLNICCYGSLMPIIAPLIDAGGGAAPASFTIDHALVMEDAGPTTVYQRYLGVMVNQATFSCSEDSPLLRLAMQLTAKTTATITITDFPAPAATAYPTDAPYVFEHLSGGLTFGSSRTEAKEFSLTVKNMLDPSFMMSQFLTRLKYTGRDVDASIKVPYIVTTDRTAYEAVTTLATDLVFTNGGHTLTFQLNGQNFIAKCDDDLSLDKLFLQSFDLENYFDNSVPGDATVTAT